MWHHVYYSDDDDYDGDGDADGDGDGDGDDEKWSDCENEWGREKCTTKER